MNRDAFLRRVRESAASGRAYRVGARDLPFGRYVPSDRKELLDRLANEVTGAGGIFHRLRDAAELHQLLERLVTEHRCQRALLWRHPLLNQADVRGALEKSGVECMDAEGAAALDAEGRRDGWLTANLGITGADAAIAETGTIVVQSALGRERVASLLPPVHLVVVDPACVMGDLFDFFTRLTPHLPDALHSNITFITGPSKTGDLELRLTTGVHGPRHWHVAVMDGINTE